MASNEGASVMLQLLTHFVATCTLASACCALPPPPLEIDEEEAKLMYQCAVAMWPAQPPFTDPVALDSPNAVGRYAAIRPQMDERARRAAGAARLSTETFEVSDPELMEITSAEYRRLLEEMQPHIGHFIDASKVVRFATYQRGRPCMQPLTENDPRQKLNSCMRIGVRLLRDDAVRCWVDGKRDDAISRVCTIIRMGGQRSRENVWMIDALVSDSMMQLGLETAARFLEDSSHPLSPASRKELLATLNTLDPLDPSGLRGAWRRTFKENSAFVNEELEGGVVGQDLQLDLGTLQGGTQFIHNLFDPLFAKIRSGVKASPDGDPIRTAAEKTLREAPEWSRSVGSWNLLRQAADEATMLHARAEATWDKPDAVESFKAIDDAVNADETGILLTIVGYPRQMCKAWRKTVDAVANLNVQLAAKK